MHGLICVSFSFGQVKTEHLHRALEDGAQSLLPRASPAAQNTALQGLHA